MPMPANVACISNDLAEFAIDLKRGAESGKKRTSNA